MPEILPSILTDDAAVLERRVRLAETFAPALHIDITDGHYVPTTSVTPADIRAVKPKIPFEIHLMVDRPEDRLLDYLSVGAQRFVLHRSSTSNIEKLLQDIQHSGCEAALSVGESTHERDLAPFLSLVQQFTFVAVTLGFQGGTLIPGVLQSAKAFHDDHPEIPIEIDGGVKEANFLQALQTGADRFVVGSAIWKSDDPALAFRRLMTIAQSLR